MKGRNKMKLNLTLVLAVGLTAAALAVSLHHAGAGAQETAGDQTSAFIEPGALGAAPDRATAVAFKAPVGQVSPDGKVAPGKDPDQDYQPMANPDKASGSSPNRENEPPEVGAPDKHPKQVAEVGFISEVVPFETEAPGIREPRTNGGANPGARMAASKSWKLTMLSSSEAQLDWYIDDLALVLKACWKKNPPLWLNVCSENMKDISNGQPGVTLVGLSNGVYHFSTIINGLDLCTEYNFHIKAGSSQMGRNQKGTTLCGCQWGDGATPFSGSYVLQGQVLQYTSKTCRLHRGYFNNDVRMDLLRSCYNPSYNALWYGTAMGFASGGSVLTGEQLEDPANICRLHVADFSGDGHSDLLRTCNDPNYNLLVKWDPNVNGFGVGEYVLTPSQLDNSTNTCRLHVADFTGDGKSDLLRSCDDRNYNHLWRGNGTPTGFDSLGYVLTAAQLENSTNTCRLHVADFVGDGKSDLLRSCDDQCYNFLIEGAPGGFSGLGYVLTGAQLQDSGGVCTLHVGNYNGTTGADLLRSCNDPAYNALFKSIP